MFKMGLHDPFGYLKHNLWPKKRSGVKVPIWFPTTKRQESPWVTYVQMACRISWKAIDKGYNFSSCLTSIWGLHKKLWASKIMRVPISRISGLPSGESRDKMTFGCRPHGQTQRILQGGRWWFPPNSGRGESCESMFACGSSMHQKCFNYALTNLLFSLCRLGWIIDPLVICPKPHLRVPACPSTLEVLRARERTQLLMLSLFSPWIHS